MRKYLILMLSIHAILLGAQDEAAHFKAVETEHQAVFAALKNSDSLLFKLGFDQCDTAALRQLIADDFEFYHDQGGFSSSKEAFLNTMSGLCKLPYKATRRLTAGSLEVHLLKENGVLYGALQMGEHAFYGEEPGKEIYLTSTAKFTHVWIRSDDGWQLKRVLSYDHQVPK